MKALPTSRFGYRLRRRSLAGSFGVHALFLAIAFIAGGVGQPQKPAPSIIPIVLTPPSATPSPKPRPKAEGDLPVRAQATPTPAPTPTPVATPKPKPSASPTPKPTPRPTPRPTPKPKPSRPPAERKQIEQMRKIPYFAKMSEAEMLKQPIPPGFKDWGQVLEMGKKLDGLQWLFLPPETSVGESTKGSPSPAVSPAASESPSPKPTPTAVPLGTPVPMPSTWPSGVPSTFPSPEVETAADGTHTMRFAVEKTVFTVTWMDKGKATVVFKPEDAPDGDAGQTFTLDAVPEDRMAFLQAIVLGWQEALKSSPVP